MLGMPTIIDFSSVDKNIEFAIENGYEFIELNLNLPYVQDYINSKKIPSNELKYTLHFFDEADFGLYDEVSDAYILLLDKYLKNSYTYIKQVNVHLNVGPIVTVSGKKNYIYKINYELYITRLKRNLIKVKKLCEKYNVSLVLENIVSLDFIKNTIEDLEDTFSFTYDIGHDYTSGNSLNEYFSNNLENFKEMHFHDSTKSKCHLELGTGELDVRKIYDLVKNKINYIVIEVKSKNDLINSIRYLKENYEK